MSSVIRELPLALAIVAVAACTTSTRRGVDGDADADGDGDGDACAEPVECDGAGFGATYEIDLDAEVVEVIDDRIVMIDAEGQPLTFAACGVELGGLVAAGQAVRASNTRTADWGECWLGQVVADGSPVAISASCLAEGEATPPLAALGWTIELEPACQGAVDSVCTATGSPVHLSLPLTVHDASVTTDTGARGDVQLGAVVGIGDWQVRLLDSRATEAVSDGGCFVAAAGSFAMTAARGSSRPPCAEPPEVSRDALGLDISASETTMPLTVLDVSADQVVLATTEGTEVVFGWYGPDARRALSVGSAVTARRYDATVTGGGFLDVLQARGRVALATIASDDFSLELPDLSAIDLYLELGEACSFDAGVAECTGETLLGQRYPVGVRPGADAAPVEAEVGETVSAGPWLATLVEASQYPGMWCPDVHVEAWGPFGITLMQEETDE
jgi:hypothetical protein